MIKILRLIKASKSNTVSEFTKRFQKGDYYSVLQIDDPTTVTDQEIKKKYHQLLKKFHYDHTQTVDPKTRLQYDQITKCIIRSYDQIQQRRTKQPKQNTTINDEDQVAILLFKKTFNEIKYDLYKPQNFSQRQLFNEELLKFKEDKQQKEILAKYGKINKNGTNAVTKLEEILYNGSQTYNYYFVWILGFTGLFIATYFGMTLINKPKKDLRINYQEPKKYTKEQLNKIQKNSKEFLKAKVDKVIKSVVDEHPPMLSYPSGDDPDVDIQLTKYSIAPDIHLYEVEPKYFFDQINTQSIKFEELQKFQITKIKHNTLMTLSLQAQRSLQNVYVKVKDVMEEINETGKYVPPKVFFRFFGYILFQIREKPLSLKNYKQTEWISLFDLYFDYYSPIFLKRNQYSQYLVGYDEIKKFGYVHLNHRVIPQVMLEKGQKYAFMRPPSTSMKQSKYVSIWNNYYQIYQRHLAKMMTKGDRNLHRNS